MTTAVPEDTRMGQAVLVEQCRCPPGYTGTSCEVGLIIIVVVVIIIITTITATTIISS